jgi:GTPase SAR1 family protein
MANIELKVVLLGKECCGKTSLVERFLNDRFAGENRYQNTIGAAFGAKVPVVSVFWSRIQRIRNFCRIRFRKKI